VSTATIVAHQARYDLRVFLRDPRARATTLLVPVVMLVFFGAVFRHDTFKFSGVTVAGNAYYLSRMIVLGITGTALSNMIISLVVERESGALKRRRATPVPPIALIGGDVVTCEVSAISITIVLWLIGWLGFGVHIPGVGFAGILLALVIGTAALCSVAYAVTPLLKSVDSAGPALTIVTVVLGIVSGLYAPDSIFPAWLRDAALFLPLRPLALAMQAAVAPATNHGNAIAWGDLGIVAAWGVVACLIAVWKFTWSPSRQ
jgi:ABC-2 type transport system permease protein